MVTRPIVLGTAGHIDHGKTSLVKALTGTDTDRLKVEKERGITTELGFASFTVPGFCVSVVDVPGHEKFIRSMAAGATGIDFVCLAVAADEGVMPQTREHIAICELLGVKQGVIVMTKVDLVDDDHLELVCLDTHDQLQGTFLENAPIVKVSNKNGGGIDTLRDCIAKQAQTVGTRETEGPFRLPIDRVFSLHGFGTIVTGTVASGTVCVGDSLEILPSHIATKVRGIEIHGSAEDQAMAGMRCALNLSGVATDQIARGDVLAYPNRVLASHAIDVELQYLKTSQGPLKHRDRLLLHHATRQYSATLSLADAPQIAPGETALAQLRVDATTPVFALPEDRFIIRGFRPQMHYGTTIGGGRVLRVAAPKLRRRGRRVGASLDTLARANPTQRLEIEIRDKRPVGIDANQLQARLGLSEKALHERIAILENHQKIVRVDRQESTVFVHRDWWLLAQQQILAMVADPTRPQGGLLREQLRNGLGPLTRADVFDQLLATLEDNQKIRVVDDRITQYAQNDTPSEIELTLANHFRQWALTPPRPKQLPQLLGISQADATRALAALTNRKRLTRIKSDYYVDSAALNELESKLLAHFETQTTLATAEWKALTGASRKYSIPLAEYFDEKKVTLRVGDVRTRRKQQ